jgi:chromosome partitioning protein
MGIFLVNSLTASDYVLIPLELSYFGVIGMQLMFNLMRMIREETNENLKLLGLVPNKFTKQTKVPKMRLKELKEAYPDAPILTTIPKAIALEKAQSEGKSIFEFEPNGRASKAFQKLAKEVVEIVEG